ncbi:hypothetical protein ADN01_16580 [Levilinea saccharolytica]|uniref:Uncharacterized protein n=1 Tax=Levilinea saccharolytica TaxID=229921 RepID=A0A0P6X2J4_9CHLR|nr:hypothetical protein ADN01_16580 [Levilinea saccharolytica]
MLQVQFSGSHLITIQVIGYNHTHAQALNQGLQKPFDGLGVFLLYIAHRHWLPCTQIHGYQNGLCLAPTAHISAIHP